MAALSREKESWLGTVVGVQPRIRLLRSFHQRSHSYLGYSLQLQGRIGERDGEFLIGIGKAAYVKFEFRVGDLVSGKSEAVADGRMESVEFYKTSQLQLLERRDSSAAPPPWETVAPDLDTYRERGHRRLLLRTYDMKCRRCIWGCRMPVEMIVDQWNPHQKRYRSEAFCYGPESCSQYRAGPTRKVPGRKGMTWEEDWIDEEATAHRDADD